MRYTKHNYKKGDELLASQLNDMDDQIALNEQTTDTLVTVSNTQPAAAKNRVWVKATPSEIEIPTMDDHNELSRQLSDLETEIDESADFYDEELGIEFRPLKGTALSTDTPYSENKIIDTPLNASKTYRITWSIPTVISIPVYVFLSDGNGNNLIKANIPAGSTEYVRDYTPNNNYSNAYLYFTVGNVPTIAVTASVSMINTPPTRIDELESTVSFLAQNALYKEESRTYTIANPDVGHYINKNGGYSALSPFSISQSIEVKSGEIIEVIATGYNNQVAIIAMVKNDYPYTVLARSISSNEETYSYQATQNITVVVSYDNRKPCTITIKKTIDVDQIAINKSYIENNKWKYAFDRICCIGDSLTSGAYYAGAWKGASIAQNYPIMLSRMLNTPVKNSGRSGASAKTWYTNNMNGLTLTDYGTFVIWLGTNEGLTDTIDTDVDPYTDYNNFADTNTGYLCRTICQIKDYVPDAHIIICTVFATSGDLTITNNVIHQVAQKYALQLVDNSDLNNTNYPLYHSNAVHFNKAGNIFVADRIMNAMINYVAPNIENAEFGLTARTD